MGAATAATSARSPTVSFPIRWIAAAGSRDSLDMSAQHYRGNRWAAGCAWCSSAESDCPPWWLRTTPVNTTTAPNSGQATAASTRLGVRGSEESRARISVAMCSSRVIGGCTRMVVRYSVVDQVHDIRAERPVRGHHDTSVPHGLRDRGELSGRAQRRPTRGAAPGRIVGCADVLGDVRTGER